MKPRFVKLINVLSPNTDPPALVDVVVFTGALAKAFEDANPGMSYARVLEAVFELPAQVYPWPFEDRPES